MVSGRILRGFRLDMGMFRGLYIHLHGGCLTADSGFYYLAMYRWEDRALSVVAREEASIDYPEIYKGQIYYTADIAETVSYKTWQDGAEQTVEEEDTVGVRLNRIALDGTGKETDF